VLGAIEVNVGAPEAITVKGTALLVPPGAVTVTFLAEPVAVALIVKVALTWVSFCTAIPLTVTPPPDTAIAVVPVSPLPKRLTATVVPRAPWFGETEASTGPSTVYVAGPLVPPGVVTVILLGPIVAVDDVLKVAVMVVALTTVTPVTVRPFAGATTLTVDPAVKLLPVSVTATGLAAAGVRRNPEAGEIEVRIGVPGATIVNVTALVLAPEAVVTVTFLAVSAAVAEIVKVASIVVSFTTVKLVTVTPLPPPPPPPPDTLTAVAPVRPVPVSTTAWVVPRAPVLGMIEVNPLAAVPVTVKVTALLLPPGAVTVTFLALAVAPAEIVNVAVTEVLLTTVRALTAMPPPDTLIAVVPVSPVPVSVTATAVP